MATNKRGLQRGLFGRKRSVLLFLDTSWFGGVPPLRKTWSPVGQPREIPIVAAGKPVGLTGVLNIRNGTFWPYGSAAYSKEEFEEVLINVRSKWRGWHIVLFLDKHSAQDAPIMRRVARSLGIELRFLPTACPHLNPVDHLWRTAKGDIAANEPTPDVVKTVRRVCAYIKALARKDRLRKAGVLSEDFWLRRLCR